MSGTTSPLSNIYSNSNSNSSNSKFKTSNGSYVIFGLFVNILLIFLSSVVALFVGYLLFFHLRLYLMDMSTVEYLSHRQQIGYYTNVHYEDEYDENPWRRPYYSNPWHRRLMYIIRKFFCLFRCWAKEFRKKDKLSSSWDSTHHNRFDVYNV
ncbi:10547_t:CDS:2 [Entrophospora sp. SA101]|nr:10547_t:CDS:2 [Entrophospora sp. SA101]